MNMRNDFRCQAVFFDFWGPGPPPTPTNRPALCGQMQSRVGVHTLLEFAGLN